MEYPVASETQRLEATVHGHVQGVGFRNFVVRAANDLGLAGWTRNGNDGLTVYVVMEGERKALESLVTRLWKGPTRARVDKVDVLWTTGTGEFSGVGIRY